MQLEFGMTLKCHLNFTAYYMNLLCFLIQKIHRFTGADPGFQVRVGAHLKKLRRAEGGAKIFGVFRVKNHDFMPKNHIFSNCRGRPEIFWGISCEKSRFYLGAPHGSAPGLSLTESRLFHEHLTPIVDYNCVIFWFSLGQNVIDLFLELRLSMKTMKPFSKSNLMLRVLPRRGKTSSTKGPWKPWVRRSYTSWGNETWFSCSSRRTTLNALWHSSG